MLSTGVCVRINPVSARLLTESMARVPRPEVPLWYDPDRDKEIPNPNDPEYQDLLKEREDRQASVAMDALIMFGVKLVDGVPDDDRWLKELKLLEKMDILDLSNYDLEDPIEREFVFKKYIAVSGADMEILRGASGLVTEEDLAEAEKSFQGDEEPAADS